MADNSLRKPIALSKVNYSRSYEAAHTVPICLTGDSRWIRDIELLMEDTWKQIYRPADPSALSKHLAQKASSLFIVEQGAFGDSEMRLIETALPKASRKLIVTNDTSNEIGWRSLQKYACSRDIPTLALPGDAKAAYQELSEVLEGMIGIGTLSYSVDFDTIHKAYLGYGLVNLEPVPEFLPVFRNLLSKFTFNHEDLSAALLLAETYSQWKAPKEAHNDLHLAYLRIESILNGKPQLGLLELARTVIESAKTPSGFSEDTWKQILSTSTFGKLTTRKLITSFSEIQTLLSKNPGGHPKSPSRGHLKFPHLVA